MNKTIVFDLDDTISFCHDRDWVNAKPNIDLIRRINKLYNEGWFIHIHSSRGQLSGIDYTDQVMEWLESNGVLFHKLEFGKPLAMLYVDDKAISVDDFMGIELEELPGGWSGNTVLRIGNKIFKKDSNIQATVAWYKSAARFYNVPEVLSVIGDQLVLRYIKPSDKKTKATFDELVFIAKSFEAIEPINKYKWKHYIDRIAQHCDWLFLNKKDEYHAVIKLLENMQQPKHTFCHGDLTPDNTVVDRKGYVNLIDPLNVTYSSFELDIAKLNSWALRNNENDIVVNTLVVSETIRTLKYAPDELYFKLRDKCLNYLRV
jgi:hypothetical protein